MARYELGGGALGLRSAEVHFLDGEKHLACPALVALFQVRLQLRAERFGLFVACGVLAVVTSPEQPLFSLSELVAGHLFAHVAPPFRLFSDFPLYHEGAPPVKPTRDGKIEKSP